MLVLALAIGAFFARRASRRLTAIHDNHRADHEGDTHLRLPVRSKKDAIDKVSHDVNLMPDEITRLLVRSRASATTLRTTCAARLRSCTPNSSAAWRVPIRGVARRDRQALAHITRRC